MTDEERNSIIDQLALIEGVNRSVFEKYTDEQLKIRMSMHYSDSEENG